ncbi:MAG TPA: alpha/beta hydrolase [Pseudonocardiaceae bacterium]|nr:alpha/beta hydrolase [Pseudonocardiaceae bacterium]
MPLVRRGTALIAAVVAVAVVPPLASCSTIAGQPLAEGRVPAGLGSYYAQDLHWGSCGFGYATDQDSEAAFSQPGVTIQCARLTVPLDYAHPDGVTASLGLLRVPATDQSHRIGSLVMNPGGPGESGMESAVGLARQITGSRLAGRFDLVGFDPRGVGASFPEIHCLTDAEQDAVRLEVPLDDPKKEAAREQADNSRYAEECGQHTGDDVLANIGTRDVAKDLDVLRAALGDAKLTYLGFSYGTMIGTAYAEDFPGNVRAMVLDGAVDPAQSADAASDAQGDGFTQAFQDFATWCAKQSHCALGTDPDKAQDRLDGLSDPLKTTPLWVTGTRRLSYSDVGTAVDAALYSRTEWTVLNKGLLDLTNGDGTTLLGLADGYLQRDPNGHYSNSQDAFTAIRCVDYPPVKSLAVLTQDEQNYDRANGIDPKDDPYVPVLDTCSYWPVPNTSTPHLPSVPGLPPVLVVSTTHDPATPYDSGVHLAKDLDGELLTFDGTQHTAYLDGNSCVDKWGTNYLLNLAAVPAGTTCK